MSPALSTAKPFFVLPPFLFHLFGTKFAFIAQPKVVKFCNIMPLYM